MQSAGGSQVPGWGRSYNLHMRHGLACMLSLTSSGKRVGIDRLRCQSLLQICKRQIRLRSDLSGSQLPRNIRMYIIGLTLCLASQLLKAASEFPHPHLFQGGRSAQHRPGLPRRSRSTFAAGPDEAGF